MMTITINHCDVGSGISTGTIVKEESGSGNSSGMNPYSAPISLISALIMIGLEQFFTVLLPSCGLEATVCC